MITIYLKQYNKIIRNRLIPSSSTNWGTTTSCWIDLLLNPTDQGAEGRRRLHGDQPPNRAAGSRRSSRILAKFFRERQRPPSSTNSQLLRADGRFVRRADPCRSSISPTKACWRRRARPNSARSASQAGRTVELPQLLETGHRLFISLLEVRIDDDWPTRRR